MRDDDKDPASAPADDYVLTRAAIDAMEGLSKVHFLNQNAKRLNKSLGDRTGLTGVGVHLIEVPPVAESTEFHVHYDEDECTYILEGAAQVHIGDAVFDVGPGDFIGYRKGGLAHTMLNTGTTPLRALVVGERRAHDMGDYPKQNKRIYRTAGRPWDLVDLDAVAHPVAGKK